MRVKKKQVEMIYLLTEDGWDYAEFYIHRWQDGRGFSLCIRSSYGNYAYAWSSPGGGLKEFLADTDFYYLAGKMSKQVFSLDSFVKEIQQEILEQRKRESISAEVARQAWDELKEGAEEYAGEGVKHYLYFQAESEYWADPGDWADRGMIVNPSFRGMYDLFWQDFISSLPADQKEPISS